MFGSIHRRFVLAAALCVAAMLGAWAPAASAQDTHFIDLGRTLTGSGAWTAQGFTVYSRTTFVLRFASDTAAQCGVFAASQLANFQNNRTFSAYGLFDRQFGTRWVTLEAGSYYVGVRSLVSGSNSCRLELDYDLEVPGWRYVGMAASSSQNVGARGGKLWQPFTVQRGRRYFLDGCNSGLTCYVIPASELNNFRAGRSFRYYTSYSGGGMDAPGLVELRLSPGTYYLVCSNTSSVSRAVTYSMEVYVPR